MRRVSNPAELMDLERNPNRLGGGSLLLAASDKANYGGPDCARVVSCVLQAVHGLPCTRDEVGNAS
jgi:hypothetical protein